MKGIIKKLLIGILAVTVLAGVAGQSDVFAKAATHNVTFIYGLKSVTVPVAHGASAPLPLDTAVPGYQFTAWVGSTDNVTEDRVILGAYTKNVPASALQSTGMWTQKYSNAKSAPFPDWWKTLNLPKGEPGKTCAVYWYNAWTGELWKTDIVPYGSSLATPPDPCIAGYDFAGWEGDWTNVTEDRAIRACYYVKHKLKFIDGQTDETIEDCYVHDGEGAYPDPPHHHDKHFIGYFNSDGEEYNGGGVHNDHTFYARYEDKKKEE